MSFLRRKSSSRTQSEASGSPVELSLPVSIVRSPRPNLLPSRLIEASHSNGGVFSASSLLAAATGAAGAAAGAGGPTSAVVAAGTQLDLESSKPVSPTLKQGASEPASPPVPVRKVSMVPVPRPTSTDSRAKLYNRNDEPPPPIPGTESEFGLAIQAPDGPVLANDASTTTTTTASMTRSVTYPKHEGRSSGSRQSIASLYPSPNIGVDFDSFSLLQTPHAFANGLGATRGPIRSRMIKSTSTPNFVRRSHRVAPPLNLIVVGAKSTGKTGWIRTFLGTLELGAEASKSRASIRSFGMGESLRQSSRRMGKILPTRETQTISVEVMGPHHEKIALTCVDTVALDRSEEEEGGKGMSPPTRGWGALDELKVERQLAKVLRIVEERFDETLKAESQVVRPSARSHDSHFHLCLYFIHPDSIRSQVRPAPTKSPAIRGSSEDGKRGAMNGHVNAGLPEEEDEEYDDEMGMTEMDLKCIKKLSQRVHVLPIIARADELTVCRLEEVKEAVRRDLARSGVTFGAFSSANASSVDEDDEEDEDEEDGDEPTTPAAPSPPGLGESPTAKSGGDGDTIKAEEDEAPVKIIRIARGRLSTLPPSRRRMSAAAAEAAEFEEAIETPTFDDYLPFAVVAPEVSTKVKKRDLAEDSDEEPQETYERHFKYGSLNVLDPKHCDFTPLKEAIFVKMKTLKETTRLDKYEPFRTKRLLERRKTVQAVQGGGGGALGVRQSLTKDLLREVEEI
ncbi:BQ2448_6114 [Microbotryum intermedium]|uniref:BQ2448_6114 protein n=1 Tax=Microbotryum intermedium TaxID=269621 RepID=A0A238FP61_9BASI|nr:BQ2448_6114 [Microbotryum intermedium]